VIVVDTNVMVYLLSGSGTRADRAADLLRQDAEWAAPPILLSELRNVLVGLVRGGRCDGREATAMHDDAVTILDDRIVGVDGPTVITAALALGLSAYDAEFVELARALDVPLVSADNEILAAAPDVARSLESVA